MLQHVTCLSFLFQPLQQTLTSLCAAHMQHFEATCMDGVRFKGKSYLGGSLFGGWHPTPCYYFHLLASPSGFFSRVIWTRGRSGKWMWLTLLDRDNVKIVKGSPFPSFSIFSTKWVGLDGSDRPIGLRPTWFLGRGSNAVSFSKLFWLIMRCPNIHFLETMLGYLCRGWPHVAELIPVTSSPEVRYDRIIDILPHVDTLTG